MRVVVFAETFPPKIDGVATMVTKTVEALRQCGDEVLIFASSGGPTEMFGAEVVGLPSFGFILYPELRLAPPRASIRAKLKAFQPDVIHVFEPVVLGIGGIYYSQVLKVPLVVSSHTNFAAYLRYYRVGLTERIIWSLMRERHRRGNVNLCTSTVTLEDLRTHGVGDLVLWQRAVDSDLFRPGARTEEMRNRLSGGEPHKRLLLYVGRLSAEKDVTKLREVIRALPEARLAIVGDGPERQGIEAHFAGTPTVFTGYLRGAELAAAFASADLFVFPSQTETLGLVLLEAMASGCPAVACRAGGIPDAIEDGMTGFLFEPDDPEGLVKTVKRALCDPARLEQVRAQARQDVELHSWGGATDQLRQLYCEAIEKHRSARPTKQWGRVKRVMSRSTVAVLRAMLP
jgi:glycosyltransferase involved in cell wall biosynthesis